MTLAYDRKTGALYDADGNGTNATTVEFATVAPRLALTAHDFLVI